MPQRTEGSPVALHVSSHLLVVVAHVAHDSAVIQHIRTSVGVPDERNVRAVRCPFLRDLSSLCSADLQQLTRVAAAVRVMLKTERPNLNCSIDLMIIMCCGCGCGCSSICEQVGEFEGGADDFLVCIGLNDGRLHRPKEPTQRVLRRHPRRHGRAPDGQQSLLVVSRRGVVRIQRHSPVERSRTVFGGGPQNQLLAIHSSEFKRPEEVAFVPSEAHTALVVKVRGKVRRQAQVRHVLAGPLDE
mmetsp:Transcript_7376/g.13781  ORF Transcript_7376/g.13781 Transcript_7376/m.13781 type:complete len:243 (-) Transcript_7376:254-982(-)